MVVLFLLGALGACQSQGSSSPNASSKTYISLSGDAIGTYYRITCADTVHPGLQSALDSIFRAITLDFSVYEPQSMLTAFNQSERGIYSPHLAALLRRAQPIHSLTSGRFDPTVGPLVKLWGFDGATPATIDSASVRTVLTYTGLQHVAVQGDSVVKQDARVQLTLNAIAKGYAVDCIAEYLESHSVHDYLVEVGGELRVAGLSPRGREWVIGIETPAPNAPLGASIAQRVAVGQGAVATSGNYRKFIERNGKTWGHTIDPTTGYPAINPLLSATVLCCSCTEADALATGLMALGPEASKALVEQLDSVEAVLIYRDDEGNLATWYSTGALSMVLDR